MKKILFILFILFIIPSVFSSSYINPITCSALSTGMCLDASFVNLEVTNQTTLANVTVTNYNITGDMDIYGNAIFYGELCDGDTGLCYSIGDVWLSDGSSTATGDWDIGTYDITAEDVYSRGTGSWFNQTLLISGDHPVSKNSDATLVIQSEVNYVSCINLTEGGDLGFQICYDGTGGGEFVIKNMRGGTEYMTIDRDDGGTVSLVAKQLNITATASSTLITSSKGLIDFDNEELSAAKYTLDNGVDIYPTFGAANARYLSFEGVADKALYFYLGSNPSIRSESGIIEVKDKLNIIDTDDPNGILATCTKLNYNLNTATTTQYPFYVQGNIQTSGAKSFYGLNFIVPMNDATNKQTGDVYGFQGLVRPFGDASKVIAGLMRVDGYAASAKTVDLAEGLRSLIESSSNGKATTFTVAKNYNAMTTLDDCSAGDLYNYYGTAPTVDGGTITTFSHIWLEDVTAGGTYTPTNVNGIVIDSNNEIGINFGTEQGTKISGDNDIVKIEGGFNVTGNFSSDYADFKTKTAKYHNDGTINTLDTNWHNMTWNITVDTESTTGFVLDNDTITTDFDGIIDYSYCFHPINNGAGGTEMGVLTRLIIDDVEARCSQSFNTQTRKSGYGSDIRAEGTVNVTSGSTIRLEYKVDNTGLDFEGNSGFDNPVASSLTLKKLSDLD